MAQTYFGIRIVEAVITIGFLIIQLSIFTLSQNYVKSGIQDASYYKNMGDLLKEGLNFSYQIYFIFYSLGFLTLFSILFRKKVIPRLISIVGLIGVLVSFIGLVLDMFGLPITFFGMRDLAGDCVDSFVSIWFGVYSKKKETKFC